MHCNILAYQALGFSIFRAYQHFQTNKLFVKYLLCPAGDG